MHAKVVKLNEDPNSRLEKRLRGKASVIISELKTSSKREQGKILEKVTYFDVMNDEVLQ